MRGHPRKNAWEARADGDHTVASAILAAVSITSAPCADYTD
jgi:hypothetical protein